MKHLDPRTPYASQEFRGLSLQGQKLQSAEFDSCTFIKCGFHETRFERCKFRECRFQGCDLSLARFNACTLTYARFEDCQLVGINWTETAPAKSFLHAPLYFAGCALNHSVFTGLNLRSMVMTKCVAIDVDFAQCDLTRADCRDTDFAESRFMDTNLTEADFTGATNYAIVASRNTLKKTKFSLPEAMSLLYNLDIVLTEA